MTSPPARRRGRSRRRGGAEVQQPQLSSVSTSREAYAETRRWLLARHGPTCAYCGVHSDPGNITLDHVTPRKGQTAYDRRDNLVLACKRCNSAKADKPFLLYLLAHLPRATNLVRFGQHLSTGILDLARPLADERALAEPLPAVRAPRVVYAAELDADSPYADSPYAAD